MEKVDVLLEVKYSDIIAEFMQLYTKTFREYLTKFQQEKLRIIEEDGLDTEGYKDKIFAEVNGIGQYKTVRPNENGDNIEFGRISEDASLSKGLMSIYDSDMGTEVELKDGGASLHQAVLDKVVGFMQSDNSHSYTGGDHKNLNFGELKTAFPELYDALAWAFKNKYLTLNTELTHMGFTDGSFPDFYTWTEIQELLSKPSITGRVPEYDLLRGLMATYDMDLDVKLIPAFSFNLNVEDDFLRLLGEYIDDEVVNTIFDDLQFLKKELGQIPAGFALGEIDMSKSTNTPLGVYQGSDLLQALFANMLNLDADQWNRMPTLSSDEIERLSKTLGLPEEMMHIDWGFVQVGSGDGFVPFYNDGEVTGNAKISLAKNMTMRKFMDMTKTFISHFKTQNVGFASSVSRGLPHLVNLYQELGGFVMISNQNLKGKFTGVNTGYDTVPLVILPEYMDNKEVNTKIIRTGDKNSLFNHEVRQLTQDFKYLDSFGNPVIINKGTIVLESQFKNLKALAKRMGIEPPQAPVNRKPRGKRKGGEIGRTNLGYAKAAIGERFNQAMKDIIFVRDVLKKQQYLSGPNISGIENPALGYEILDFEYKGWDKYTSSKPTIYTDLFTKVSLGLRAMKKEDEFLRQTLVAMFDGQFVDTEQRIIAIPVHGSNTGFAFLNTNSLSPEDMWNMAYMKSGNKDFTPDIYFGGNIGKVNYTPEVTKGLRKIILVEDLLEFFDKTITNITSVAPGNVEGYGVTPGPSTVYPIWQMSENSPKTLLKLFEQYIGTPGEDIFDELDDNIIEGLTRLYKKLSNAGISIDELPDDVDYYKLFSKAEDTDEYVQLMQDLDSKLKDAGLNLENRISGRARAGGQRPSFESDTLLVDLLTDSSTSANMSTIPSTGSGDAAYRVNNLVSFFDLTQYSDYELQVTGLAQGPSHMNGKDINEAKSVVANLVTGNPTVYSNYSFKFLNRFDGTTAIPFINENTKDVFKKNLLLANRIFASDVDNMDTRVAYFDVSPVQTGPVYKNKYHMLEFDIGIVDRLPNGGEDVNRIYTQVAYSFDEATGELKIHHYVDNLPNDSNTLAGSVVRRQGNISNLYAIKDSAIIKSLMELYDITDETKVIDGGEFLALSVGVDTIDQTNYDTLKIIPGKLAHAFGLVGVNDPDPDSSMYTKTMSESNAPLLRSRKMADLKGVFNDLGTHIIEVFNDTQEVLVDDDIRLQPITNNPNYYISFLEDKVMVGDDLINFVNNTRVDFEKFGLKQDNISGFNLRNVTLYFVNENGDNIKLTGSLNQDLVFTHINYLDSDNLDGDQINNVLDDTIKRNLNIDDFSGLSEQEIVALRRNYIVFPQLNTTTGKYEFSTLTSKLDNQEFVLDTIKFENSSLNAYGDTETALDINEAMKDGGFIFSDPNGGVHTYNPFVTEIMESNSYMGQGELDRRVSGVQTASGTDADDMFRIYMENIYGQQKHLNGGDPLSFPYFPEKFYPLPNRYPKFIDPRNAHRFFDTGYFADQVQNDNYTDGLTRHSRVVSSDIAKVAKLSGSAVKTALKPVGAAFKLLEKFDVADKIVMKSIKPVASVIAKGALVGGAAVSASTVGAALATAYAVQELYLLAHGLIREGDLFGDTQKLMKELRDDNPGDGAWKRFWISTGKNAWKGLEWQQDHSVSGWVEKKLISGAGMAFNEIIERRNNNVDYVKEVASFAERNNQIFDTVNKYDPQYNDDFDNINNHMRLSMQNYGNPQHKSHLNKELNRVTSYPVWKNSENLLYNGNEEYLATVDNYIKIAEAYEGIGY